MSSERRPHEDLLKSGVALHSLQSTSLWTPAPSMLSLPAASLSVRLLVAYIYGELEVPGNVCPPERNLLPPIIDDTGV